MTHGISENDHLNGGFPWRVQADQRREDGVSSLLRSLLDSRQLNRSRMKGITPHQLVREHYLPLFWGRRKQFVQRPPPGQWGQKSVLAPSVPMPCVRVTFITIFTLFIAFFNNNLAYSTL